MDRINRAKKSHINSEYFKSKIYESEYSDFLSLFLKYDLGNQGDITSDFVFDKDFSAEAIIIGRENFVLAGKEEFFSFLRASFDIWNVESATNIEEFNDGDNILSGDILFKLIGPIKSLLKLERSMLNFLQRMSGIASICNKASAKCGESVLICPTRKTFWGSLDKKACMLGGAGTHRINLNDAVLIKNNHLGSMQDNEFELANKPLPTNLSFFEVEVNTMQEAVYYALKMNEMNSDIEKIIMLDNMWPEQILSTIENLKDKNLYDGILIEASGGISLENLDQYLNTGVDIISMGELTHSARAVDISMKINGV